MMTRLMHTTLHATLHKISCAIPSLVSRGVIASSFVLAAVFGPPHIVVTPVKPPANAAGAAAFTIEAGHHSDRDQLTVSGRAESMRNGARLSRPLTLARTGDGRYSVAKQWEDGTAWVLVFSAEQGPRGTHGVAEAIVQIDAKGAIAGIAYPQPGWEAPGNTPKRTTDREIQASLATLVARR